MKYRCAHCRKVKDKPTGEVNRARAAGLNLYCNRRCAGFGRRKGKTTAQKRAEKAAYDKIYRIKNLERITAQKAARHKETYDPAKAAVERKKRMPLHVQYCRQPWYKAWKKEYDLKYRAKKFEAFADAYQLTIELNREIKRRMSNAEIKYQNGCANKAQRNRREACREERRAGHTPAHR
jgi:hypothetical protein